MNWIDSHSHVWPADHARYALAPGFSAERILPASFPPEDLLKEAEAEGVRRVVLIQVSFHGFDNRYIADQLDRHPGRFGAVGCVDWTADRPDEAMRPLVRRGFRGFRIRQGSGPPERWCESPSLERMFRFGAEERVAICPLMEPSGLPSLARMCARHPRTPVVIDHLCRIGFDGEMREREVHSLCELAQFPEVRVKVSAFYALGKKRPPYEDLEPLVRRVHGAFGARRLLWGSDSPFQIAQGGYAASIGFVRDRLPWLPAQDRDRLLRTTAEELFFRR